MKKKTFVLPLIYASLGFLLWIILQSRVGIRIGNLIIHLCCFALPVIALVVSRKTASSHTVGLVKIAGLALAGLQIVASLVFFSRINSGMPAPVLGRIPGCGITFSLAGLFQMRVLLPLLAASFLSNMLLILANASCYFLGVREKQAVTLYRIGTSGLFGLGIGAVLAIMISLISLMFYGRVYFFGGYAITGVLWFIVFFAVVWAFVSVPLLSVGDASYRLQAQKAKNAEASGDGYIDITKHVLLCLFTFGIWYLIWIYRTTAYLNRAPGAEPYNPTNKLLLCMFVPFYSIFWLYKHGQRLDALSGTRNLQGSDMATLCLILGIFIPIVACILLQDRINSIARAEKPDNN